MTTAILCETLALGLRRRGYEVAWRTSATEALAALDVEPYDAVVTDLNMRGSSGIDLCAHVVERRRTCRSWS